MKREEIEGLLADYASGEMSPADKQQLEILFKQDLALKQEAYEMVSVWKALDRIGEQTQPNDQMDAQFYTTLQRAKADLPARVVTINKTWLQIAAAILICITAFGIGRFTAPPKAVVEYKTVYIKQPVMVQPAVAQQAPVSTQIATLPKRASKPVEIKEISPLTQQLRSVYASERIGAVMKITGKSKLTTADLQALELALKEDPNANVRLTILDALRPQAALQNVQAVLIAAMDKQDDGLVRSAILDMLIDNKSKQAIPQMIALLDDKKTDMATQNKIKAGIESFLN